VVGGRCCFWVFQSQTLLESGTVRVFQAQNFATASDRDDGFGRWLRGGFLAESFAEDGFTVTGVDPAAPSIEAAQKHASEKGLTIDYRIGRGEALPFPDGSFEVVTCCDVLEHVDDLDKTVSEIARLLKPGGVFFYETVTRTWLSKLVLIKIWQDWRITRLCDPNTHVWEKFIKPVELEELMRSHGLINQERKGISLKNRNPMAMLWTLRSIAKGGVRNTDLPDRLGLCEADKLSLNYMGYAIKSPAESGRSGGPRAGTFSACSLPPPKEGANHE
jgi:2-polyprenyl-6-hydroxyphenyl methylase / 3-demethylubiquinone-9 3-methyltransferase